MEQTRLLIIDDEPDAGEILSLRLGRHVLSAHYTTNGPAGLEFLQNNPVDVVLLDVKMPGMDGLQVLEVIRNTHQGVAVIMISGHADMDSAARGLELGASQYLLKPVDFQVLLHKIEDAQTERRLSILGSE